MGIWNSLVKKTAARSEPSPGSEKASPNRYFHLSEGDGGTYTLPITHTFSDGSEVKIDAIGTHSCRSGVAVYIPLSKDGKRCFAAHFSGRIFYPPTNIEDILEEDDYGRSHSAASSLLQRIPTEFQGAALKQKVTNRLAEELPDVVDCGLPDAQAQSIILCPWPIINGQASVSHYILEAVMEFFQFRYSKLGGPKRNAHGFIMKAGTTEKQLRWKSLMTPELSGPQDDFKRFTKSYKEEKPEDIGWKAYNGRRWRIEWDDSTEWSWST